MPITHTYILDEIAAVIPILDENGCRAHAYHLCRVLDRLQLFHNVTKNFSAQEVVRLWENINNE